MDMLTGGVLALTAAAIVQTLLVWRAMRAVSRLATIEARVEKFGDALTLLTDTTESAFRAIATEMTRPPVVAAKTAPALSAARTRRITRAATRGATVQQIAAAEDVAEGEVRLRLQMANDQPGRRAPKTPAKKKRSAPPKATTSKGEARRGTVRLD